MKPPKRLQSLIEEGLIDTVVLQLMSGKEAAVYVVRREPQDQEQPSGARHGQGHQVWPTVAGGGVAKC